jgi:hypothetical protein
MKITLTKNEMKVVEMVGRAIRAASQLMNSIGKDEKKRKRIRQTYEMFINQTDKWGHCKLTDEGSEFYMKEEAFIDFVNIIQSVVVKCMGFIEGIVTTFFSVDSFIDSLGQEFDRHWSTKKYIRVEKDLVRIEDPAVFEELESELGLCARQIWRMTSTRGDNYLVCRDDEEICVIKEETKSFIFSTTYHIDSYDIGNQVRDYRNEWTKIQDEAVEHGNTEELEHTHDMLDVSDNEIYKMPERELKRILKHCSVIKEIK